MAKIVCQKFAIYLFFPPDNLITLALFVRRNFAASFTISNAVWLKN
jgi:hypothetical protein